MGRIGTIARRTFLIGSAALGGGLAVGYYFYARPKGNPLEKLVSGDWTTFNPYVMIEKTGRIVIVAPRAEMGQGVATTLATLVAEELEVALDKVEVRHGPVSGAYYNAEAVAEGAPFAHFEDGAIANVFRAVMGGTGKALSLQITGGSSSAIDAFDRMRLAGAAAREMLKAAAAARLGVSAQSLKAANGAVTDPASGTALTYGELAPDAAKLEPLQDVALKDRKDWTILGKAQKRVDMKDKVTGAPIYGIDVDLPDMVYATVRMNPDLGAPMKRFDAAAAQKMNGVLKVFAIDCHAGSGIGVVATNTWAAFRAAEAVEIEWEKANYPQDSAGLFAMLEQALDTETGTSLRTMGDVDAAFADAPPERVVTARYAVPFLAHACMEPMNATAQFKDGKLTLWSPTQTPTLARFACAQLLGISQDNVTVNVTSLGGGFGRRLEQDFSLYAALAAKETDGRPVKVAWTREEDMTHDAYRPAAMADFRALLGADGLPAALDGRIAVPSVTAGIVGRTVPMLKGLPVNPDIAPTDGAFNQPCDIPNFRMGGIVTELGVPAGMWRSVGNSHNGFFHETFMDEIASAGKVDPVAMRLKLMTAHPTAVKVVETVAEMANWNGPKQDGRAKGFAFTLSFGGWVGQIVEVSGTADLVRIENVWCAADIGIVLDPLIVERQIVSAAIYGLSSAMGQEINFKDGMVQQSNFHDYDAMRINQCPAFHVKLLETAPKMGGVGEIGTPPSIPALGNAIFALTGKRLRQMPFTKEVAFA